MHIMILLSLTLEVNCSLCGDTIYLGSIKLSVPARWATVITGFCRLQAFAGFCFTHREGENYRKLPVAAWPSVRDCRNHFSVAGSLRCVAGLSDRRTVLCLP
ncbi:hypothetical protein PoB_003084800 [Plakobranchus ocellatus]|uniref:Secreted protein n=1 Tax=Plakobranchus ocellatus TaxID=259542 RepID=A0AAV4AAS9_9GAST|nr:hypothetical protein PoB_003084800 [Plakobranchus ocellatus]